MPELQGLTALVTGATSGIGRDVAKKLAAEGAAVVVSGRNTGRGRDTVAAIEAEGGTARFAAADMTDLESVRRLADEAGDVEIVVNNAGIYTFAATPEQDVAAFDEMFSVNVRAPFFLTARLVPRMAAKGGGSIVNVSTMAASIGVPGAAVYGASKAALESFTRSWASEFGSKGVRVNTVAPGPTLTESAPASLVDPLAADTFLARHADVGEIANVITFLASPRSSYVTGATVMVDGGRTVA